MEIPADLLTTSTADNLAHGHRNGRGDDHALHEIDNKEMNQLAAHLPDIILNMDLSVQPPFVRQFPGVIMFLDISGFTDLSEKCSANGLAGADQLTAILNDYMGAMIDEVLRIKGDVLKFAGDAILVFWKIQDYDHLLKLIKAVIECSCNIQAKYGTYNAEGLTTLRVKIALSLGRMYFFVFGRDSHYFYCESGKAVQDAKDAEAMSKAGDVIVSPYMWSYCEEKDFVFGLLEDGKHVKVMGLARQEAERSVHAGGAAGDPARRAAKAVGEGVTTSGEVYRKAAFETGIHLNEMLSKYVINIVLDKLEAGHGIEYHSEIRSCTIAFINLLLVREDLKASNQCDVLQKAHAAISGELETYKASLNKVVMFDKGCSFLIVFGLPGRKDSYDCKHAVQCAYKIRTKLQDLPEVKVASAGITTGHTFCGVVGHHHRHEYTVIGKMVNMAARLMTNYPGMVSCDNETYTHSRLRQHNFKDVPVKNLKGLTDVGIIREYTEDSAHISFVASSLTRTSKPLIARERELKVFTRNFKKLLEYDPTAAAVMNAAKASKPVKSKTSQSDSKSSKTSTASADKQSSEKEDNSSIVDDGEKEVNPSIEDDGEKEDNRSIEEDDEKEDNPAIIKNLLMYEGVQDSGTTRLLAEIASIAESTDGVAVADLTLTSNDASRQFLGLRSVLASLLNMPYGEGKAGERLEALTQLLLLEYSQKEVKAIVKCVEDVLMLNSDVEESRIEAGEFNAGDDNDLTLHVLETIFNLALEQGVKLFVLVVDDADYLDMATWNFVHNLSARYDVMVVMSMLNYEKSVPVEYIERFLALSNLQRCVVEPLPADLLAVVACQMINVSALPVEVEQLLMEKTQGMPGYIRHILTDLLTSQDLQIVSVLQYQTDFDDYTWPDFEMISGHPTVLERKKSMLRTRNKWAFHAQLPEDRDPAEDRICIISPGSHFSAAAYRTPNSLKGQLLIEFDQLNPSEQMALKCTSVIGNVCSVQILHMLWPFPVGSLKSALTTLFNKDMLRCYTACRQLTGKDVYNNCICEDSSGPSECKIINFSNHLMRDTVYSILLEDQRTEMHYKVAKFIEAASSHLTDDTADEIIYQELPFFGDDISNIFVDCKAITAPADRPDLNYSYIKPSLYTHIRMNSSVQSYVADQVGGFCSQKLLDWLMEQNANDPTANKKPTSTFTSSSNDELARAAGKLFGNRNKKKSRGQRMSQNMRSRAAAFKRLVTRRNDIQNDYANSSASLTMLPQLRSGSRKTRANSVSQNRRRSRSQSANSTNAPLSGRRRNASTNDASLSADNLASRFSKAFSQAISSTEHEVDMLQSRRESVATADSARRPIIGRSPVDIEHKSALFRQVLWHWRAALDVKNTLFTLVEAACVALQYRMLYQAHLYLKYALIFTDKIKAKVNPLTGEPLSDQTDLMVEFWVGHSTKLATLHSLIYCATGEYDEASTLHTTSLQELGFKLPTDKFKIWLKKFKHDLNIAVTSTRLCLPSVLHKSVKPVELSMQLEKCRLLSSLYQSNTKSHNKRLNQLLLHCSLSISKHIKNSFEVMIAYGNWISYYQRIGKFSSGHTVLNQALLKLEHLKASSNKKDKKEAIKLAVFYLHVNALESALCEGMPAKISSAAGMLREETQLGENDSLKMYMIPLLHQAMFRTGEKQELRKELLKDLEAVDDAAYFCCLWEEFVSAGFTTSIVITQSMKDELVSYTQEVLGYRMDNLPDEESNDIDVYENNVLTSYVLYMLVKKMFASPRDIQNSILLLESVQLKELTTYWGVYVYSKAVKACLLSLEHVKHSDTLTELATKMLAKLRICCKPVPSLCPTFKKLSQSFTQWNKEGKLPSDILYIADSARL